MTKDEAQDKLATMMDDLSDIVQDTSSPVAKRLYEAHQRIHMVYIKLAPDRLERKKASVKAGEKLQLVRGNLLRLKGYLKTPGHPRVALDWVAEALEIVEVLQTEV